MLEQLPKIGNGCLILDYYELHTQSNLSIPYASSSYPIVLSPQKGMIIKGYARNCRWFN